MERWEGGCFRFCVVGAEEEEEGEMVLVLVRGGGG